MSEDAKSSTNKGRRPLRVVNPGPDSGSEEDNIRQYTVYPNPTSQHYLPPPGAATHSPYTGRYVTSRLSTNLPSDNSLRYPSSRSNPTLSSPSSTSSHVVESTPPPITPSLSTPPADFSADTLSSQESSITPGSVDRFDGFPPSRTTNIHMLNSQLHHRNGNQLQHRAPASSSPPFRPAPSPTTSIPDTYSSPINPSSASPDKRLILVTADSDQYMTVDITGAKNPAFIRERIFNKLRVWEEEHQSKFSIYRTEIGGFAIGEALTDERLFDLCQEYDAKGTLKFLVSHSSASVHEEPPQSSSVSPTVTTIPPPVLPYGYGALRSKHGSGSRPSSLSSASEKLPPEIATGYEASVSDDLDNVDRDRPTARRPLPGLAGVNAPLSPHGNRRPSAQLPRSISPNMSSFRPMSPPAQIYDRGRNDTLRDKYGNMAHNAQPPPPLSPTRPNVALQDDNNITPPMRLPHMRSGSDPAAEREQALRASENQLELAHQRQKQFQRQMDEKGISDRPKDGQPGDELDQIGRADPWVLVSRDSPRVNWDPSTPQDGSRSSPLYRSRHYRAPPNHKSQPSYIRGLVIPKAPRHPPPTPPVNSGESRHSPHKAGQPVPSHWTVTWKGEGKAPEKPIPPSPAQLGLLTRPIDKSKSMGDLKASTFGNAHPPGLQPGRRQLPVTRANGGSTGIYGPGDSSRVREPGVPKSYEPQRNMRAHGLPPPPTSQEFSQWTLNPSGGLTFVSPSRDPYPRPQSAIGDALGTPASRYTQNAQSPTQDAMPASQFPGPATSRLPSNIVASQTSDNYGGIDSSRPPPHSPSSPLETRSNLPRERYTAGKSTGTTSQERPREVSDPEPTLKQEDHGWIVRLLDGQSTNEETLMPTQMPDSGSSIKPPSSDIPTHRKQPSLPEDESDSDGDRGTWIKRPDEPNSRPISIMRRPSSRPPLKVRIETPSGSSTLIPPATNHASSNSTIVAPHAARPAPSRPHKRSVRGSTFTDMLDYTWAPRPPPEDVYERLEEFFPNHDLDKPVIEASSGGTSPTAAEQTMIPPPAMNDKSRVKSKKSIRIVAEEHKKRIDRTSRADASISTVLRKRSTKLWGSRLEEVTTAQAKAGLAASLPDSPSGGPKPIFKWVRGELIGKGTYGRVYLALNATTGEMIAVKQVEMPRTASDKNDSRQITVVQALKMESETLKDLDHPNIVQYLGFEETPSFLSIFLEYVPGGSIGSCLQKHGAFDEDVTKSFMSQILGGLEYLHSRNILHRDLKADNILVETSGICKISDFGISKRTDDISGGAFTAMQGTVFWMAPEVINTQKKGYNFKIDIWSVGCVILEMWAGSRPWLGDEAIAVMFKLYQAKLPPPIPDGLVLSALADDFRLQCFAINPEERPTAAQLRKHPYLSLPPGWVFNGFSNRI